jgi:hypothetical protein
MPLPASIFLLAGVISVACSGEAAAGAHMALSQTAIDAAISQTGAVGQTDALETLNAWELSELSGEGGVAIGVLTNQTLTAISTGNQISADAVNSGSISLDESAFSGFDGIGNFVINSGHNNNLQSSLSVTIVLSQ